MSKTLLQIGATNFTSFISSYKLDYNVLVKDEGRNANGDLTITILNRKAKINCVFKPMKDAEMDTFLDAIQPYVLTITYWDPRSQTTKNGSFYTGTASPDFYKTETGLFKELSLNFIEL